MGNTLSSLTKKVKWAILAVALALSASVKAMEFDEWTKEQKLKQVGIVGLYLIDRAQTRDIKNHPQLEEKNPFLGKSPSDKKIDRHFAKVLVLHTLVAAALPSKHRDTFQTWTYVVEGAVIANNFRIGLNVRF